MNKFTINKIFINRIISRIYIFSAVVIIGLSSNELKAESVSLAERHIGLLLQSERVTIDIANSTLERILIEISRQSSINYVFKKGVEVDKQRKYSLKVSNIPASEALDRLLSTTQYTYGIEGGMIVIDKREVSQPQQQMQPQELTAKGKVVDKNGNPLIGATIIIVGTQEGAITDEKGEYTINTTVGTKATISMNGFVEVTVTLKADIQIIELIEDEMAVDEVVVTGLFNARKETYTGAATSITQKEIRAISTTNIFAVISALDPSFVTVENNEMGSNPNALPEFQLRGSNSISALKEEFEGDPNAPLFIIDGIESSIERVYDLDPMLIKSITLLKDASATAIYGSKASNGIVVIETGKPVAGKVRVSYTSSYILTTPDLSSYNVLDASRKVELELLAGIIEPGTDKYNDRMYSLAQGVDSYWLSQPLRVGNDLTHSLSVSGGDEYVTYNVTLRAADNSGVMIGSNRERIALSNNLTYRTKDLIVSNTLSIDKVDSNNSPYGSFSTYATLNPYYSIYDQNGEYTLILGDNEDYNPLWNTTVESIDNNRYVSITDNLAAKWMILDNLIIDGSVGFTLRTGTIEEFVSSLHTSFVQVQDFTQRGSYTKSDSEALSVQAKLGLQYSYVNDNHILSLNSGLQYSDNNSSSAGFSAVGFPNDNLTSPSFANSYASGGKPTGYSSISRTAGFYLNTNYSFNMKYYADLSFRADISSKFGSESRWAPFGSIGFGYNIHQENFLKNSRTINLLKVRASYGLTGSQNYDPYQANSRFEYITDQFYNNYSVGAELMGLGNENLKWQRQLQSNIGVDFAMIDNRLSGSVNYYSKISTDVLTSISTAPSTGFSSYMANLGKLENRGYEIFLRGVAYRNRDWTLSVSANAAHNTNKLVEISNSLEAWNSVQDDAFSDSDENQTKPRVRYIEGESMNAIWGVQSLGIDPATGRELFIDKDGNKTYTWSADDQIVMGVSDPTLQGSIGFNLSYKALTLSAYAKYSFGGYKYNSTLVERVENANLKDNVDERAFEERWKIPGDDAPFKAIDDDSTTKPSTRFVELDNYLTLTSLNVSYDMKRYLLKDVKFIRSMTLSFNTNDLFHVSTIKLERGTTYPFARTFNFSLNVGF